MGRFLTIGYGSRTIGYCFPIVFWKLLWGGCDGGDKIMTGIPQSPGSQPGKTLQCMQKKTSVKESKYSYLILPKGFIAETKSVSLHPSATALQ